MRINTHQTKPIQNTNDRNILKIIKLHQSQQRAHRATIELKNTQNITTTEQLINNQIVEDLAQLVEIDLLTAIHPHVRQNIVKNHKIAQTQEIHLDQPKHLTAQIIKLNNNLTVLLTTHDKNKIEQKLTKHNNTHHIHSPLTLETLKTEHSLDHLARIKINLIQHTKLPNLTIPLILKIKNPQKQNILTHNHQKHNLNKLLTHHKQKTHNT